MQTVKLSLLTFALGILAIGATVTGAETKTMKESTSSAPGASHERITMGGGCFWCLEAVFQRLNGVKKVVSGYSNGNVDNPTYKQVCTGNTGHAEVVQIEFDPAVLPREKLLEVFWAAHDPTTLNRQGGDTGTQYRSGLYYENEAQKAAFEKSKAAAAKDFRDPIVTEIAPLKKWYPAEDYHQNYFNENGDKNPYCQVVIQPKLKKLLKSGLIKE